MDSTRFKLAPSLGRRVIGLYYLGTCLTGYRWRVEFSVRLLTLLQRQSYLVPCISERTFIIPKLLNICWRKFISEFFSRCIEHLPNCCFVRHSVYYLSPDWTIREHFPHALPTEMIFYLLRSIRSERLRCDDSAELILEIIIKWLQVSFNECKRQTDPSD